MATRAPIVHLTGAPAAGKRTVALAVVEEMAARGRHAVLLDNHRTGNLILDVVGADGRTSLPAGVWERVGEVREAVFSAIEELAPPDWTFVLTNVLIAGQPLDEAAAARVVELAARRRSAYVPVALTCDLDVLVQRVPNPERAGLRKWIDPDGVRALVETRELIVPAGALHLDTTAVSPTEAAKQIVDHVEALT
jgi:hypothetical protein